jgi:hypothetical protein
LRESVGYKSIKNRRTGQSAQKTIFICSSVVCGQAHDSPLTTGGGPWFACVSANGAPFGLLRFKLAAPIGNKFWLAASTHGRHKLFESPQALWDACVEYFNWVDDNPLFEEKAFNTKDGPDAIDVRKMRAMTITGLCLFLDIAQETWHRYRKNNEFRAICSKVESVIKEQKFTGAAADLLNPSIIARDLGLVDRKSIEGGSTPIAISSDVTPQKATELWLDVVNSEDIVEQEQIAHQKDDEE